RYQREAVPETGGLGESSRRGPDTADLAGETDLSDRDKVGGQRQAMSGRSDGEGDAKIRRRLDDPDAVAGRPDHLAVEDPGLRAPLQDGEHHGQARTVEPADRSAR